MQLFVWFYKNCHLKDEYIKRSIVIPFAFKSCKITPFLKVKVFMETFLLSIFVLSLKNLYPK
jgi:hypothetical protein